MGFVPAWPRRSTRSAGPGPGSACRPARRPRPTADGPGSQRWAGRPGCWRSRSCPSRSPVSWAGRWRRRSGRISRCGLAWMSRRSWPGCRGRRCPGRTAAGRWPCTRWSACSGRRTRRAPGCCRGRCGSWSRSPPPILAAVRCWIMRKSCGTCWPRSAPPARTPRTCGSSRSRRRRRSAMSWTGGRPMCCTFPGTAPPARCTWKTRTARPGRSPPGSSWTWPSRRAGCRR